MTHPSTLIIDDADDGHEWDGFVQASPSATGYHLWGWRRVFERAFGHPTQYLCARANGRVVGILPLVVFDNWLFGRFAVSLPFVNYGGIVTDDQRVARLLIDRALALGRERGLAHVELRHRAPRFSDLPSKQHKVAMTMPLDADVTRMWDKLDRKVRNQVRKAEKSLLTAHDGHAELVDEFYDVFARNMRDLGTPVVSSRFFKEVLNQFPDRTRVYVVRANRRPVAASITFGYGSTVEAPWASSLRRYRASAPNMLLYWTMMRSAVADGYQVFDFGRSTPGAGTFQFKRQWGAVAEPLTWEYGLLTGHEMPDLNPANRRFAAAIRAWQHMPVWAARIMGPAVVRNLPA